MKRIDEAEFIESELHVVASEELEKEIEEELKIPDPPKDKLVSLAGEGKLLRRLAQ